MLRHTSSKLWTFDLPYQTSDEMSNMNLHQSNDLVRKST